MNRKPVFDAVRKLLGRGFTADEVKKLDAAFVQAEGTIAGTQAPPPLPTTQEESGGARAIGAAGLTLIKSFEGCETDLPDGRFAAYPDPGSSDGHPWTIGWGSTGKDVAKGVIWTAQQCDDRFAIDMRKYANAVAKELGDAPTTQNQFDALVSFHYNTGAIATATLTKKHKAGKYAEAKAEFAKWVYNAGSVMRGLVRRRTAEAELYAKP